MTSKYALNKEISTLQEEMGSLNRNRQKMIDSALRQKDRRAEEQHKRLQRVIRIARAHRDGEMIKSLHTIQKYLDLAREDPTVEFTLFMKLVDEHLSFIEDIPMDSGDKMPEWTPGDYYGHRRGSWT